MTLPPIFLAEPLPTSSFLGVRCETRR
ncbi:hypothetical protein CY0110_15962 [Crocosphaera chwakensis CCY0110]|uniref:Uncharacterized protein n=1 Tax=Crocosphaera chwakensis CCY0110 TaxID=391612 RepID=A3IHM4_9CHRO|nr:hypothetical protein CY0110_15962 [Crocosphaera chwakensis CCY0110]